MSLIKLGRTWFILTAWWIFFAPWYVCIAEQGKTPSAWTNTLPIRTWTDLRIRNVVLQKLDFSCGAASLATISTFYLGKPVTEAQALRIIQARYAGPEWKKKQEVGLSFEDLAYIAHQLGLEAQAGEIGLAGILQFQGPVIVHLKKSKDLSHFSVLRGINGMTVYLADPFVGMTPMSLSNFVEEFSGAVLAVWDPDKPLPLEYVLKLREQDAHYDNPHRIVRQSLYHRLRPIGPSF